VVFCTGGGGTICSVQVKALVSLGANAAILGRRKPDVTPKERKKHSHRQAMAKEIEAERKGAKCLAISADVRDLKSMEAAVAETIQEFGRIDFVIAGAAGNFLATIDVC
jgi:2,4-dienoyl-CoA reductase [(3E)-enoyl-CoA-producing], peroxisomal